MTSASAIFTIKEATVQDIPVLFSLIQELAAYEKMSDQVTATEAGLGECLFSDSTIKALIARSGDTAIGYALYFFTFSTFLGKKGLHLEDLFLLPQYRGHGYGKALFVEVAKAAHAHNCCRMEWACLNWNLPSIAFYTSLGAEPMDSWTDYRLTEEGIQQVAGIHSR